MDSTEALRMQYLKIRSKRHRRLSNIQQKSKTQDQKSPREKDLRNPRLGYRLVHRTSYPENSANMLSVSWLTGPVRWCFGPEVQRLVSNSRVTWRHRTDYSTIRGPTTSWLGDPDSRPMCIRPVRCATDRKLLLSPQRPELDGGSINTS
jgi:hypothetical protein